MTVNRINPGCSLNFLDHLSALLDRCDFDGFIDSAYLYYSNQIKIVEKREHYEEKFAALGPIMSRYGDILKRGPYPNRSPPTSKICYFLPNLDNDLAHIEFLHTLLSCHAKETEPTIFVAGVVTGAHRARSRLLRRLESEGRIEIIPISAGHTGLIEFLRVFFSRQISLLVVYSIPVLLDAFLAVLGSDRVAWVPTKFRLNCFANLKHRVHFGPASLSGGQVSDDNWLVSPLALERSDIPEYALHDNERIRVVSVNREEKIRDPRFLFTIAEILRRCPEVDFYWTGRHEDAQITAFFEKTGVASQVKFIGWIEPSSTIRHFDLFADTFGLSGSVAAKAFAAGLPTISCRHAGAWAELFERDIVSDDVVSNSGWSINELLVDSCESYVNTACKLISSKDLRFSRSLIQKYIGERYFCNSKLAYTKHIQCLRSCIEKIS